MQRGSRNKHRLAFFNANHEAAADNMAEGMVERYEVLREVRLNPLRGRYALPAASTSTTANASQSCFYFDKLKSIPLFMYKKDTTLLLGSLWDFVFKNIEEIATC